MPWKGEKDPYRIWLSEVILQQTRVEQGLAYYQKFIHSFPDVHKLAAADDEKIFKLWEGLGYYSRCRNLIHSARFISLKYKGRFPQTYEEIRSLKGVGPYTAAAIASFGFNLPYAVVDGNVYRVLSRFFGITVPVDTGKGKKLFAELAEELLDKKTPGLYNQAIMDFGAVVCKPVAPLCTSCVLKKNCVAFTMGVVGNLPVKGKKVKIKKRWFNYLLLQKGNRIAICKREQKDIWQDLYEFPLIETRAPASPALVLKKAAQVYGFEKKDMDRVSASGIISQQLSHQLISGRFIELRINKNIETPGNWLWVRKNELALYSFPRFIHQYLQG